MKIELDVNPGELSKSIVEIISNLTPDQKTDLAKQTMEKWLKEPYDLERKVKEREVIEHVLSQKRQYGPKNEAEARSEYEFREAMRGWKSTKDTMVETITKEISEAYKSEVKRVVESDQKIQAMKDEVVEIIRQTFPKTVHAAMVQWMASSMSTMFETTMGIKSTSEQRTQMEQNVFNRLIQVESKLGGRPV